MYIVCVENNIYHSKTNFKILSRITARSKFTYILLPTPCPNRHKIDFIFWIKLKTIGKLNESNDIARSQKWPVLESSSFNATIIAHIGQERFGDYSRIKEATKGAFAAKKRKLILSEETDKRHSLYGMRRL